MKQTSAAERPVYGKGTVSVSPLVMNPGQGATKAGRVDTITTEALARVVALTGGSFNIGYSCTGLPYVNNQPNWNAIGSIPSVWFTMGSGWMSCKYGSGEIGYSLDFGERGYYTFVLDRPYNTYGITGAITLVGRARSSVDSVNSKEMPLKFKLYSYPLGQITRQEGYNDITSSQRGQTTTEVYYPQNPENFLCYSETVGVPVLEPEGSERFGTDWFGAKFETPGIAGANPCISIVFPTSRTGEDSLWNATLFEVSNGDNTSHSTKPAAMYVVYDFDYQSIWSYNEENGGGRIEERIDGFIPDSNAQPNKRYAVVPLQSWNWTDANGTPTSSQDGEIPMHIILAEGVAIERGAAYDKYVEVKINPAIDYTVIQSTDRIKSVEIYNLNGKLVKTQACNSNNERISLNGLASGMYIAKVTTEAGIANKKIMVR